MEKTSERIHEIDFDEIRRIIKDEWNELGSLDTVWEKLIEKSRYMSREEAVIRLMIDLPKSG